MMVEWSLDSDIVAQGELVLAKGRSNGLVLLAPVVLAGVMHGTVVTQQQPLVVAGVAPASGTSEARR